MLFKTHAKKDTDIDCFYTFSVEDVLEIPRIYICY